MYVYVYACIYTIYIYNSLSDIHMPVVQPLSEGCHNN